MLPSRKPRACVPCHERKVRCDHAEIGVPCSRCVAKDRAQECRPLARPERNSSRRKQAYRATSHNSEDPTSNDNVIAPVTPASPSEHLTAIIAPELPRGDDAHESPVPPPAPNVAECVTVSTSELPDYTNAEEDAHLQTLCRMSENQAVDLSPSSTANNFQASHRIIEYYSDFNAITVLGQALRQPRHRRLVQIDLSSPQAASVVERELSRLDDIDRAYLQQRQVHNFPPREACDALLRLFFRYVFPYTPVIDRVSFICDYKRENCSSFLMYAMFSITVPYASQDTVQALGFANAAEAQKEFFTRARLLYDVGCEKGQLNLLQGSIFMSSFQHCFAPDKDFRFWFTNATRIATQMGLHRQNLGKDLSQSMHRVCRRIWWLLYQRDFIFNLSGFENTTRLNHEEADTSMLDRSDWIEDKFPEGATQFLPPITSIHIQFSIYSSKLAILGSTCLRMCRKVGEPYALNKVREMGDAIKSWRSTLPKELLMESISDWTADNVWVIVIHATSYRLESLFYRTVRQHVVDDESSAWLHQRLNATMFELSTLIRRAMTFDVIQYGPPSLIITATQLMALQIEAALSPKCTRSQRLSFETEIHTMLQYVRDSEAVWGHARWALRALEGVVKGTGLALHQTGFKYNGVPAEPWDFSTHEQGSEEVANMRIASGQDGHAGNQAEIFMQAEPWDTFPDSWFRDILDTGMLTGFHEEIGLRPGTPR